MYKCFKPEPLESHPRVTHTFFSVVLLPCTYEIRLFKAAQRHDNSHRLLYRMGWAPVEELIFCPNAGGVEDLVYLTPEDHDLFFFFCISFDVEWETNQAPADVKQLWLRLRSLYWAFCCSLVNGVSKWSRPYTPATLWVFCQSLPAVCGFKKVRSTLQANFYLFDHSLYYLIGLLTSSIL